MLVMSETFFVICKSQSMIHVLNGKAAYILRATDALTTKLNRLSQDTRYQSYRQNIFLLADQIKPICGRKQRRCLTNATMTHQLLYAQLMY